MISALKDNSSSKSMSNKNDELSSAENLPLKKRSRRVLNSCKPNDVISDDIDSSSNTEENEKPSEIVAKESNEMNIFNFIKRSQNDSSTIEEGAVTNSSCNEILCVDSVDSNDAKKDSACSENLESIKIAKTLNNEVEKLTSSATGKTKQLKKPNVRPLTVRRRKLSLKAKLSGIYTCDDKIKLDVSKSSRRKNNAMNSSKDTGVVSEITNTSPKKLKKFIKYEDNISDDLSRPSSDYPEGSLVWAKVQGFPYWPCIILADPASGEMTRRKVLPSRTSENGALKHSEDSGKLISYHIRFCGARCGRGWTVDRNLIYEYDSGEAYLGRLKEMIDEVYHKSKSSNAKHAKKGIKSKISMITAKYGIKPNMKASWEQAVSDANIIKRMSLPKRIQNYGFTRQNKIECNEVKEKSVSSEDLSPKKSQKRKRGIINKTASSPSSEKARKLSSCDESNKSTKNASTFDTKSKSPEISSNFKKSQVEKKLGQKSSKNSRAKKSKTFNFDNPSDENFTSFSDYRKYVKSECLNLETDCNDIYQFVSKSPLKSGNFKAFMRKMLPQVKKENQDMIGDVKLKNLITDMWNGMSSRQKSRYKSAIETNKKSKARKRIEINVEEVTPPERKSSMKISIGKFGKFEASLNSNICSIDDISDKSSSDLNSETIVDSAGESVISNDGIVNGHIDSTMQHKKHAKKLKHKSIFNEGSDFKSLNGGMAADRVCNECETVGQLIHCKGLCQNWFHPKCVGVGDDCVDFMCSDCSSGKQKCFECKSLDMSLIRCNASLCGKFYHRNCLEKYSELTRVQGRNFICPLHVCLSCVNDGISSHHSRVPRGKVVRCVRCPTAFHKSELCLAAGSNMLTSSAIICPAHFEVKKGNPYHSHVNVNWCFICSEGGSLICCETCPAAFHPGCLDINPPDGSYYCSDCITRNYIRYGNIVWIKLGQYRWWPGIVKAQDELPTNILSMKHSVGEFAVQFSGSHDYYWLHRGRVFLFHEGDKGSREGNMRKYLSKVFIRAVSEATAAFQEWQEVTKCRLAEEQERIISKPIYKAIKFNRPYGKIASIVNLPVERNPCECDPDQDRPCGIYSTCINRMMMMECNTAVCLAGERCENQRFQRLQYTPVEPFRTDDNKGWGLRTTAEIKQGQFVIEYVGELIDDEECRKRITRMNGENEKNFYFLTIDKDRIIDAGPKGNRARFMNHCCQPNCETQKWNVNGDTRVGLFALFDIQPYTELTFNYNLECLGDEKTRCMCGAPNCSGFIGIRPKALPTVNQVKKSNQKKKRKKKKLVQHEDICFRCDDGGDLVLCSRKTCTKCYHLSCLNLEFLPPGKWDCPWHHCDYCGKPATTLCFLCPNSFCKKHSTEEFITPWQEDSNKFICHEHDDDDEECDEDDEKNVQTLNVEDESDFFL